MDRKEQILQATAQLIANESLHSLTLSRVAEKVNMTKQGVLHYFPSVDILKHAALDWCDNQYFRKYIDTIESIDPHPGRALQAYIDTVLVPYRQQADTLSIGATILHASICDIAAINSSHTKSYGRLKADCIADGSDIAEATVIIAALDTLCFGGPFVDNLSKAERQRTWDVLLQRVQNMKGI